MVIGDNCLDAKGFGVFDRSHRRNSVVHGNDELGAGSRSSINKLRRQTVTVLVAVRD